MAARRLSAGSPRGSSRAAVFARILGAAALALWLAACQRPAGVLRFEGATMGTTYHITVVDAPRGATRARLQADIDRVLARIDQTMSTWRADSEISRFNAAPVGEWFALSPETYTVLAAARSMNVESAGRFDVTVAPLLAAWGFGPHGSGPRVPADDEIAAVLARVGSDAIELGLDPPRARKRAAREVELSAIAPGFAVDEIARAFALRGVRSYLVELGGEVRTSGRNDAGEAWRIAIEQPDAPPGTPALAIRIDRGSVSTSGDYREFFESGGQRYSHTLDPATGRPVRHALASVTVIAPDCMRADALATALHVLGPEAGMAMAEREGLPVFMIVRDGPGRFSTSASHAFRAYALP